jgi:hypothetical protein
MDVYLQGTVTKNFQEVQPPHLHINLPDQDHGMQGQDQKETPAHPYMTPILSLR